MSERVGKWFRCTINQSITTVRCPVCLLSGACVCRPPILPSSGETTIHPSTTPNTHERTHTHMGAFTDSRRTGRQTERGRGRGA